MSDETHPVRLIDTGNSCRVAGVQIITFTTRRGYMKRAQRNFAGYLTAWRVVKMAQSVHFIGGDWTTIDQ
uniref:Uncharacterized protein n=1 Tax=Oryza punctata TaxID=4537 RepID=A0A0E0KBN3_ORYPU